MFDRKPDFWVRDVPVYGDLALSPMAGFSDFPFRCMCRRYGSAMSYTEFVSALALVQKRWNPKSRRMLSFVEQERPVVFQIFDSDEDRLVEAARRIEELGPDIIDINMGCSVRHVSGRGAGAGLLREPRKIGRIFTRLVKVLSVPVTGKIRLGWDESSLNYREVVRILDDSGASLVAVHARTRSQAYSGHADWTAISEIVETVQIPVLGNGDVFTAQDVDRMKQQTGCAGVMVGRGAIGHPWIFQRRDRTQVRFAEKERFIQDHFSLMQRFYGDQLALLLIRKHITHYLKGYSGIRDLQQQLVRVESAQRLHSLLAQVTRRIDPGGARAGEPSSEKTPKAS